MPPVGLKRGGANNSADRESWQLKEVQARRLIAASHAASRAGLPLNRFVTIGWGIAGIEGRDATKATGTFIKFARDWITNHSGVMPWVWVQERGEKFGQHAHILLHVPAQLALTFRVMPRRWVTSIAGGKYPNGLINTQKLSAAKTLEANLMAYEAQLGGKLHYMLKCTPERLEADLGLAQWAMKPWGQSGLVIGKRAATWQGWGRSDPCKLAGEGQR